MLESVKKQTRLLQAGAGAAMPFPSLVVTAAGILSNGRGARGPHTAPHFLSSPCAQPQRQRDDMSGVYSRYNTAARVELINWWTSVRMALPNGTFAEAQAAYLEPDAKAVDALVAELSAKNIGLVAHFYMDPEVQGVLMAAKAKYPHIFISDSLAGPFTSHLSSST